MMKHFYLSRREAAETLDIGISQFKKVCKSVGITRWPSRKMMAVQRLIDGHQTTPELRDKRVLSELKDARAKLLENPQLPYEQVVPNRQLLSNRLRKNKRCRLKAPRNRLGSVPSNERVCRKLPKPSDKICATTNTEQPTTETQPTKEELLRTTPFTKFPRLIIGTTAENSQ